MQATETIPRCPRCFNPIVRRSRIEKANIDGQSKIVHAGCRAPSERKSVAAPHIPNYNGGYAPAPTAYPEPSTRTEPKEDPMQDGADIDKMFSAVETRMSSKIQQLVAAAVARQVADAAKGLSEDVDSIAVKAKEAVDKAVEKSTDLVNDAVQRAMKLVADGLQKVSQDSNELFGDLALQTEKRIADEVCEQSSKLQKHVFVIKKHDEPERKLDDSQVYHSVFTEVLELVLAGFNVFMPGPTGCGKTVLARQVADALDRPFGMISGTAGTTETEILGISIPNITTGENVYIETEFVRLYENGGLFLLDEGDAMDPNCLLKINAAIANGYCPIPKRTVRPLAVRHKDFSFIMAANTFGNGADRAYCGRNKLDEATLDRFRCATIPMDYSEVIELCAVHGDMELYSVLLGWRRKIVENRFQRVLSTRFMAGAWILKHHLGKDYKYIADRLTGGWTQRERDEVVGVLK